MLKKIILCVFLLLPVGALAETVNGNLIIQDGQIIMQGNQWPAIDMWGSKVFPNGSYWRGITVAGYQPWFSCLSWGSPPGQAGTGATVRPDDLVCVMNSEYGGGERAMTIAGWKSFTRLTFGGFPPGTPQFTGGHIGFDTWKEKAFDDPIWVWDGVTVDPQNKPIFKSLKNLWKCEVHQELGTTPLPAYCN